MKKLLKIFLIEDSTTLFSPILSTDCETKTTVRWIDHRGCVGSLNAMENTINSFKNAAGIETDIYPTLDNKFVCVHDATPLRDEYGNRKKEKIY